MTLEEIRQKYDERVGICQNEGRKNIVVACSIAGREVMPELVNLLGIKEASKTINQWRKDDTGN